MSTPDEIRQRLRGLSDEAARAADGPLADLGRMVSAAAGAAVFRPGDAPSAFMLLLTGIVRVEMVSAAGRSAVLYRITPGESCVLTTSCLLSDQSYSASALAETDIEALTVPRTTFLELLMQDEGVRALVFGGYAARLADLTRVIEDLLLKRVDARLAQFLADRAPLVESTHEALAHELGAAREAISRILKEFERRGWLTLGRGRIEVAAPEALRRFAEAIGARPL